MPKLLGISFVGPYQLQIKYDDDVEGIIDCTPKHQNSVFQRLSDYNFFTQAKIDSKHNTIVRDEDLDIDGLGCYCQITGKNFYSLSH